MLNYLPVPLDRLQIGQTLPVDILASDGRLLLRRGQTLQSPAQRDMLGAHQACMREADAQAWYRSLERQMRQLRANGIELQVIAQCPMPGTVEPSDYREELVAASDWLDLQEKLRSLLYQGAAASHALVRLEGLAEQALNLLQQDPDDALFVLFQALPEWRLSYVATHALLCAVVSALALDKLGTDKYQQARLMRAALVMNIGMAREQDMLAKQPNPPDAKQRQIITEHAANSSTLLRQLGVQDDAWLELVQWHHAPDGAASQGHPQQDLQVLNLSETLVAKMAPRLSRPALSTLAAAKALVLQNNPQSANLRVAMAAVLGFYPPGSYVTLVNGDRAVVLGRGALATTPRVASISGADGVALSKYVFHDTAQASFRVLAALPSAQVKVRVNREKVAHLRQQHPL